MAINTGKNINFDFCVEDKSEVKNSYFINDPMSNYYDTQSKGVITEAIDVGEFVDDYGTKVNIAAVDLDDVLVKNMQSTNDFEVARDIYTTATNSVIDLSHYEDNSTLVLGGNVSPTFYYNNEYLNTYLDEYLNSLTEIEKERFINSKIGELERVLAMASTPRDKVCAIAQFFATSFPKVRYGHNMHYSYNNVFHNPSVANLIGALCNGAPFDCSSLVSTALMYSNIDISPYYITSNHNSSSSTSRLLSANDIKLLDQKNSRDFANYNLQEGDILTIQNTNHVGIVMDIDRNKGEAYILHSTGNDQVSGTSIITMDLDSWRVKDFTNDYGKTGINDAHLNIGDIYFDNVAYLDSFLQR